MSEMSFAECCRAILRSRANEYAKSYAAAGLHLWPNEIRAQALYILNNIQHWREPAAKQVRANLKRIASHE